MKRILLVGGNGVFGMRLAERLATSVECEILLAGRSLLKLEHTIAKLRHKKNKARFLAHVIDRQTITARDITGLGVFLVIDAAGPFQPNSFNLVQAAIAAGCHFIDIADARGYIGEFRKLDAQAKSKNVIAITGAGATPAISNAVVDRMTKNWHSIKTVDIYNVPGNEVPRGLSTMRSILSYVGQPVRVRENLQWITHRGWEFPTRVSIKKVGKRLVSICETADLDIMPRRYPGVQTVRCYLGLGVRTLHFSLWAASLLVKWGWLKSLVGSSSLFLMMAKLLDWLGPKRSGMKIVVQGEDQARKKSTAWWSLVAANGSGAYLPILPAVILTKKLLAGIEMTAGARICVGMLSFAEIQAEFAGLDMTSEYKSKS